MSRKKELQVLGMDNDALRAFQNQLRYLIIADYTVRTPEVPHLHIELEYQLRCLRI
jgi:hypothetical protein